MTAHAIIDCGHVTSVVKRRRRRGPVYARSAGCAACGFSANLARAYPECDGRTLPGLRSRVSARSRLAALVCRPASKRRGPRWGLPRWSWSRVWHYQQVVPEADEGRVELLLLRARVAGIVKQFDGSRGSFWWNGTSGAAMRALRKAIGGVPVRRADDIEALQAAANGWPYEEFYVPRPRARGQRLRLPYTHLDGTDQRPGARAVCRRCFAPLFDREPCGSRAEFIHPAGECPLAQRYMKPADFVPWRRKRDRRARRRGARHARKYRPR